MTAVAGPLWPPTACICSLAAPTISTFDGNGTVDVVVVDSVVVGASVVVVVDSVVVVSSVVVVASVVTVVVESFSVTAGRPDSVMGGSVCADTDGPSPLHAVSNHPSAGSRKTTDPDAARRLICA